MKSRTWIICGLGVIALAALIRFLAPSPQPVAPPVPWDSVGIRSQVLIELYQREHKPDHPFCEATPCTVTHEVLGEYDLPYKTRKAKLVVAASTEEHHICHSCGPSLSFFEFTQQPTEWTLTNAQFAVLEWGQQGAAYPWGLTVAPLGEDIYGIFLAAGEMHQGFINKATNILAPVNKELREVAQIPTGEDDTGALNAGATQWDATVTVDPKGTGFHDLIVTSSGTRDTEKFSKVERYKFSGTEYALVP